MAGDFEVKKDANGAWFWTLQSGSNETVARSWLSFDTREKCLHGIRAVKSVAATALVFDMSGPSRAMVEDEKIK
jgi:uncharacterized protein YegP (UPF0339 family)